MLVLDRKQEESILIDGGIRIMVIKTRGNRVRLGITAPDGTTILRSELYDGDDIPQKLPPINHKASNAQASVNKAVHSGFITESHARQLQDNERDFIARHFKAGVR